MTETGNKIKYGLKNLYYALVDESDLKNVAYGAPKALYGATSISLKANVERTVIPADDDPEYAVIEDNKGYEGDLEVQNLSDEFKKDVLGFIEDENGVLVEQEGAKTKPIALLFEFSGDKKKTRHALYRCRVGKPNLESGTTGDKIDNKTDSLSITATPAKDSRIIKAKAMQGDTEYGDWFEEVYVPTMPAEASEMSEGL